MSKKPKPSPEEDAYNLLQELREQRRLTRETLAELKQTQRELAASKEEVLLLIQGIREGVLAEKIKTMVEKEVAVYAETIQQGSQDASEQVQRRVAELASAIMGGIPPELLMSGAKVRPLNPKEPMFLQTVKRRGS